MNYLIRIVQPHQDLNWQCFLEVAAGVKYSLEHLGHTCTLDLDRSVDLNSARCIIFNAWRLGPEVKIPYDAIIFNAEQVQTEGTPGEEWRRSSYLNTLKTHIVWDYSQENMSRLSKLGVTRTVHCPVGYWPGLSDIAPAPTQDIDVLFVGSRNDRRNVILNSLQAKGLQVRTLFGVYGKGRNDCIARSKVVLNTHYYPNPIWEIFRTSHLMANKKCVVTEDGGCDIGLELLANAACAYVPYNRVVDTCVDRVNTNWKEVGDHGFNVFSKCDQVEYVREALRNSA